ncbi:MAG: hypothetical protein GTO18_22245 [Anaerolineales bacterium]|nr:hypothetical protein [Anaerolineales bacterium]
MSLGAVDRDFLQEFEHSINPRHPEQSKIPLKVLGYGEISTVLEIEREGLRHLAFKRMPMFESEAEVDDFLRVYQNYLDVLGGRIGVNLIPSETTWVTGSDGKRVVLYIIQEKIHSQTIGHHVIHKLSDEKVPLFVRNVLDELKKVFDFNRTHKGKIEVGIDGQISNWAITGFNPESPDLVDQVDLVYFDTSTPLLQLEGEEQLNPELFLRSAPSFLVWILKLLFLEDVMTRYYNPRLVAVDLIGNFYKEGRPELVPQMVEEANAFLASGDSEVTYGPITIEEVDKYYREDSMIWRLYLASRKVDRTIHRLFNSYYPYVLPEKIER